MQTEAQRIEQRIVLSLRTCYDPEIPVNILELGLIYAIDVDDHGCAAIKMTLTSPNCPAAQELPVEVKERAERTMGVTAINVEVVWQPPWHAGMMTEAAQLQLNL